jgi:hypothetical protein
MEAAALAQDGFVAGGRLSVEFFVQPEFGVGISFPTNQKVAQVRSPLLVMRFGQEF